MRYIRGVIPTALLPLLLTMMPQNAPQPRDPAPALLVPVVVTAHDWKPMHPGDRLLRYRRSPQGVRELSKLSESLAELAEIREAQPMHGCAIRVWLVDGEREPNRRDVRAVMARHGCEFESSVDPSERPLDELRVLRVKVRKEWPGAAKAVEPAPLQTEERARHGLLRAILALGRHYAAPEASLVRYAGDPRFDEVLRLAEAQVELETALGFGVVSGDLQLDEWSALQGAMLDATTLRDERVRQLQMRLWLVQTPGDRTSSLQREARDVFRLAYANHWRVCTQIAEDALANAKRVAGDPAKAGMHARYLNLHEFAKTAAEVAQLLSVPGY